MTASGNDWRPTTTRDVLVKRAEALARVRGFFADRNVLEVDTPAIVNAPVSDVHIHSAEVRFPDDPLTAARAGEGAHAGVVPGAARFFLHTSPEFAMKRLLAAGSGDIYQICHVARGLERGRHHNAEFTLIEWDRLGFSLVALMSEVDALSRAVLGPSPNTQLNTLKSERLTYREAFMREAGLDPFTCSDAELAAAARELGFNVNAGNVAATGADAAQVSQSPATRDELLDLIMGAQIGPRLGRGALTFVHAYPASQAALARLDPSDSRCAERFELYCEGVELANGFHELASAAEQRARFEADNAERRRRALPTRALDERLLAALDHGLPECSGVALGFDRLLMLATGADRIDDVIPFPTERA